MDAISEITTLIVNNGVAVFVAVYSLTTVNKTLDMLASKIDELIVIVKERG